MEERISWVEVIAPHLAWLTISSLLGALGLAVGYIKGRFDKRSETAVVLTDEQVAMMVNATNAGAKPGGSNAKS